LFTSYDTEEIIYLMLTIIAVSMPVFLFGKMFSKNIKAKNKTP